MLPETHPAGVRAVRRVLGALGHPVSELVVSFGAAENFGVLHVSLPLVDVAPFAALADVPPEQAGAWRTDHRSRRGPPETVARLSLPAKAPTASRPEFSRAQERQPGLTRGAPRLGEEPLRLPATEVRRPIPLAEPAPPGASSPRTPEAQSTGVQAPQSPQSPRTLPARPSGADARGESLGPTAGPPGRAAPLAFVPEGNLNPPDLRPAGAEKELASASRLHAEQSLASDSWSLLNKLTRELLEPEPQGPRGRILSSKSHREAGGSRSPTLSPSRTVADEARTAAAGEPGASPRGEGVLPEHRERRTVEVSAAGGTSGMGAEEPGVALPAPVLAWPEPALFHGPTGGQPAVTAGGGFPAVEARGESLAAGKPACEFEAEDLAALINEVLVEQARRHGVDLA